MVEQAIAEGATISYGYKSMGEWIGLDVYTQQKGYFFPPTILTGLDDEEKFTICKEEVFGPIACVMPFDTEDEVIERANKLEYGLCGTVHSQNATRIHRVSSQLNTGTVWVNSWLVRDLRMPFGGFKHSGTGREGAHDSQEFFTEQKCVSICY